jgi:small nuclear ribonucleoprotein (snRNP)-like protein
MDGALKPARTGGKAGRKVLGKLTVNLSADVNEMIAILPGFDDAVNLINDTVIANLQGSINATVADDYAKWRVGESAKTRVNA